MGTKRSESKTDVIECTLEFVGRSLVRAACAALGAEVEAESVAAAQEGLKALAAEKGVDAEKLFWKWI